MSRVLLYTPIAVLLGGLAALATFPEVAVHLSPLIGESSRPKFNCPISAMLSADGADSCSSAAQPAAGECCRGLGTCTLTIEDFSTGSDNALNDDLTATDSPSVADDSPADAVAAVNVEVND